MRALLRLQNVVVSDHFDVLGLALAARAALHSDVVASLLVLDALVCVIFRRDILNFQVIGLLGNRHLLRDGLDLALLSGARPSHLGQLFDNCLRRAIVLISNLLSILCALFPCAPASFL